jgi:hypothetical protein
MSNKQQMKEKGRPHHTKATKEIEEDSRFASVNSDPRFMKMPYKQKKVVIDDRFKSVLTSKKFN